MSEEIHLPKEEVIAQYLSELLNTGLTEEEIGKKIGVSQSTVSRFLGKGMGLNYDSVYKAIILIQEYYSPLPNTPIKNFSYPKNLTGILSNEPLWEAGLRIKQGGYTQLPVYEKETLAGKAKLNCIGIVTDLGLLNRMVMPWKSVSKDKWLNELANLTVKDANVIEHVAKYPEDSSLIEVAEGLFHHYAVLITEVNSDDVIGIITRNDIVRIWLELIGNLSSKNQI
jgi:predicted transcriptional regulator